MPLARTWRVGAAMSAGGFEAGRTALHPQVDVRTISATAMRVTRPIRPKRLSQQASLPFPSSVGPLVVQRAICRVAQPPPAGRSPRRVWSLPSQVTVFSSDIRAKVLGNDLALFPCDRFRNPPSVPWIQE